MRAPVLTLKRARKLRRKMTLPEVLLWERIRGGRLNGLRFRRQHPDRAVRSGFLLRFGARGGRD
jgi:very-short-patch-repair endonuclease